VAFACVALTNQGYGPYWVEIGLTIGLSTAFVVLCSSLLGSMLPLLLRACRTDPATSSAPFVATLADVSGLIIYFSIAIVILKGTVL
jgi:magnesium transporter